MKKALIALLILMPLPSFAASTCDDYFKSIDNYLALVGNTPAMKGQLDMVKSQYEQSKKQLEALPASTKEATCKQGLDAMTQAMDQLKKMK